MQLLKPDGIDIVSCAYVKSIGLIPEKFSTRPYESKPALYSYGVQPYQSLGERHIPQWTPKTNYVDYHYKHALEATLEKFDALKQLRKPSLTAIASVMAQAAVYEKIQQNTKTIAAQNSLTRLPETEMFRDMVQETETLMHDHANICVLYDFKGSLNDLCKEIYYGFGNRPQALSPLNR